MAVSACSSADENRAGFEPADNMDEIQRRHRLVPDDDIWWTVTGEQMAWMHRNAHQLFPTVNVYRSGPVKELQYELNPKIGEYLVDTPDGQMSLDEFLPSDHSTSMGIVILHQGRIVFERYPRMKDHEKVIYWSTVKVMPATIIRILEERGQIDVSEPVKTYLPELRSSPFGGIMVRNILDMASGIDCGDEYVDRESCYYRYSMAIGDGFRDADAPDNPYDFLKTLDAAKVAEQGTQYSYSGVNTFILAWLVEEITGHAFQDVFTQEIWQHIGAESDASFIAYRYGIPLTHGGFLSNMRDLARFGLLFTPSYQTVSDRKIISDEHIEFLQSPGNPALRGEDGTQSIYQWGAHPNGDLSKGGWGGQGIIINPDRDLVAVYVAYFKDDYSEVALEPIVFDLLEKLYGEAD
jgi:hypothetical protein